MDAANDLWGASAILQRNLTCCEFGGIGSGYRIDLLAGYRFLKLSDNVRIYEQLVNSDPLGPLLLGTVFEVTDNYQSHSDFHGLELGLRGEWVINRNFIAAEARAALGRSFHRLDVDGQTTVSVPGQVPVSFAGGLLASGGRVGEYTNREFAVVPQAELRVGRRVTDHLRVSVGYSLLYWSQVVRAGEQMSTTINSSQLPSPGTPAVANGQTLLFSSSYWAQGLTASLEWNY